MNGLDNPVAASPGDMPGFPPGDFLVESYTQRCGRDLSAWAWSLGFTFGGLVPVLAERGHHALDS
ncbi:hypothetical protein [Actinomadura sp. SCN-SB]|uniref:hypothetical protein n=1 Tax=Actinomadura sp. SCN-SB TaxID=3373092 RepID=UPI00375286C4